MSHAAAWRCRAEACRTVLGQVRDGVLRPLVPVGSVDGRGVERSYARATRRTVASSNGRPTIWSETGRPSGPKPHGATAAGKPSKFQGKW